MIESEITYELLLEFKQQHPFIKDIILGWYDGVIIWAIVEEEQTEFRFTTILASAMVPERGGEELVVEGIKYNSILYEKGNIIIVDFDEIIKDGKHELVLGVRCNPHMEISEFLPDILKLRKNISIAGNNDSNHSNLVR